jgi:hypothetical protein
VSAIKIFNLCVNKKMKGHICSHEITTLAYFMEKEKYNSNKRNRIIIRLLNNLEVLTADKKILRNALESEIDDYEDAVIDEIAINESIDFIVTRNLKDYKKSKNKIVNALEMVKIMEYEMEGSA